MNRRRFLQCTGLAAIAFSTVCLAAEAPQPNILFAFADDWSWPQSHLVDDPALPMPTFSRICREGVRFRHAFVSSPSCTPSRGAILTGQYHWRLKEGANLWSTLPPEFSVYPDLLEAAGYHVGFCRKGWGPGQDGRRPRNPAGKRYKDFKTFLAARPQGKPFCFWFGSFDPHRGYKLGSGVASGMDPAQVKLPACLPDTETVRRDLCDYYWEVARFDRETGELLKLLEEGGELDNTLVVMSGDNGLPFPRCKSNLYDTGTRVPLAVRWKGRIPSDRTVDDFISLCDLAPTFLELAGLTPPAAMTARSFLDILVSRGEGQVDRTRDHVLVGKERHTCAQEGSTAGYPCRAIRTRDFLYIRNYKPALWPAGTPSVYRDCDGSPTKSEMIARAAQPDIKPLFDLAFAKRSAEELYDLRRDPGQLKNVAEAPAYAEIRKRLASQLAAELKATADPREIGGADAFDRYPYLGRAARPKKK